MTNETPDFSKGIPMLAGHFEGALEYFKPLSGSLPATLHYRFEEVVARARTMLENRDEQEVINAINHIEWPLVFVYSQINPTELVYQATQSSSSGTAVSRIKLLLAFKNKVILPIDLFFPKIKWHEYFYCLALAYVGRAIYKLNTLQDFGQDAIEGSEFKNRLIFEALNSAEEAIHTADGEHYKTKRGAKGATKKIEHQGWNQVKDECIKIYKEKYKKYSNKKAAMIIFSELPADMQSVFKTDSPEETIERWIANK